MGFKKTSDIIAVSFGLDESAANTFTEETIALQLDVLNNEIFVVLAVDLNPASPELVPGISTETRAVSFTRAAEESYSGNLDYVALIATNNFFVAVQGTGNAAAKSVNGRVYGYRARADGTTYAALVQSEVLSA